MTGCAATAGAASSPVTTIASTSARRSIRDPLRSLRFPLAGMPSGEAAETPRLRRSCGYPSAMRRALPLLSLLLALAFPALAAADVVDDNPAAASLKAGRLDVAARAADGTILTRHLDTATGTWSAWAAVPGLAATSGPALVADDDGLHVAARGPGQATFTATGDGTTWGAWSSLGGASITGPGIANRQGQTTLDVGVTGTDGRFCHKYRPAPGSSFTSY